MWSHTYDIIVETLTGSEFEVTVNDRDTVGYIKSKIQKYEGIPVNQQHLLYNHKELTDSMEMKDIPLVNGSRLKLVLGMKGGPISSKRLVTIADYDHWIDMSEVLSRQDTINLKTPGVKLLVYKDNKNNVHRLMKVRAEKAGNGVKSSISRSVIGSGAAVPGTSGDVGQNSQKERDNAITTQKLNQIKSKLNMKKKKLASPAGVVLDGEAGAFGLLNATDDETVIKEEKTPIARPVTTCSAGPIGSALGHRKSMPTVGSGHDPFLPFINLHGAFSRHTRELDKHTQIRENLQRNRSFKTISAKNLDFARDHLSHDTSRLERSLSFRSNGILNRLDSETIGGMGSGIGGGGGGRGIGVSSASQPRVSSCTQSLHQRDEKMSSASLHDIIEIFKYNHSTKLHTISNDALNKIVSTSKKHHHHPGASKKTLSDNSSLKNIDEYFRDYDIGMKTTTAATAAAGGLAGECKITSAEIAFDKGSTSGGLDKPFRTLYKSTSDDNSAYELPKLLIREDSPVESFHSSYPQLETVALRGESPKNFNSLGKLQDPTGATVDDAPHPALAAASGLTKAVGDKGTLAPDSLLQLYDHLAAENGKSSGNPFGGAGAGSSLTPTGSRNSWSHHHLYHPHRTSHHHSDLGINELELFINGSNGGSSSLLDKINGGSNNTGNGSVVKLPPVSNLEMNTWCNASHDSVKQADEELASSRPRISSNSTNFVHSDLSISSDEDDLFNIVDVGYKNANKSKSIDLNEFRKAFGSSPTLLNNFGGTNYSLVPQLSRLDTIPSQYRRGYTNLNDACLSSSTSELECVNNASAKKKTAGVDGSELSPLLKHRTNDHIAYVRSYENLNRYKGFGGAGAKNGNGAVGSNSAGGTSGDALYLRQNQQQQHPLPGVSNLDSIADSDLNSNSSGSNLIDDSFTDFEYRFSRLNCSNGASTSCCAGTSGSNVGHFGPCTGTGDSGSSSGSSNHSNRLSSLNERNHRIGTQNLGQPSSSSSSHMFNDGSPLSPFRGSNNTSTPATNYYFPSDESLFNMDAFFDDFVEIDTSDIFDSAEFINIGNQQHPTATGVGGNGASSGNSKLHHKSGNHSASSLLLPDFLQQEELLLKTQPFSPDPDDLLDGGIASLIHQIDGEKLSSLTATTTTATATFSTASVLAADSSHLLPAVSVPLLSNIGESGLNGGRHLASGSSSHHTSDQIKSKKLRCAQCNKKLGVIMIMRCHCEKIFCAQHRYAEAHNCSFDFKHEGRKLLERENPLVVAQKLPKI